MAGVEWTSLMCGFGMDLIFKVAIFSIVVLVVLALLRVAFGDFLGGITAMPYWNVIQIVIGRVIAILILLLFIWRLANCAGLFGGRVGDVADEFGEMADNDTLFDNLPGRRKRRRSDDEPGDARFGFREVKAAWRDEGPLPPQYWKAHPSGKGGPSVGQGVTPPPVTSVWSASDAAANGMTLSNGGLTVIRIG